MSDEKIEPQNEDRLAAALEIPTMVVENFFSVATDKLEMEVDTHCCVVEKLEPVVVDKRSHEVEMPLVVKKPRELRPAVKVEVIVEKVEPTFVL